MKLRELSSWFYLHCSSLRHRHAFGDVATCCLFLGHPRSGSTLAGALVNSHRHAVISQELNLVQYLRKGEDRDQLFTRILLRDQRFGRRLHWRWSGYDYHIPGQWQGRFEQLRVIGDKDAGCTTRLMGGRPHLLDRLRNVVSCEVRFICVTRNPFDNIATMYRRKARGRPGTRMKPLTLEATVERYFQNCAYNRALRERIEPRNFYVYHHEKMISEPRVQLAALCRYLELDCPDDYLEACAGTLYPSARQSRHDIEWPEPVIRDVESRIKEFDFLEGYTYTP